MNDTTVVEVRTENCVLSNFFREKYAPRVADDVMDAIFFQFALATTAAISTTADWSVTDTKLAKSAPC